MKQLFAVVAQVKSKRAVYGEVFTAESANAHQLRLVPAEVLHVLLTVLQEAYESS